jgi:hypothetical protein
MIQSSNSHIEATLPFLDIEAVLSKKTGREDGTTLVLNTGVWERSEIVLFRKGVILHG